MPGVNVRVHVIEARELKGVDSGGTSDPIGVITVMGKKQETEQYNKCTSVVFDKLMFFEFDNLTNEEIQRGTILLEMYDYNLIARNELIGKYEFGVGKTNTKPGHEEYKKWVALFNPERGLEPQGFLKVSISVVKSGQAHSDHMDDEHEDDDEMVLMPPDLDMKTFTLNTTVYRAKDLPKVDTWGTCDGYMKISYGGIVQRTEVVTGLNPEWKVELRMPVAVPTMSDSVEVSLFDQDIGAADDFIGSSFYSYREISSAGLIGPHWTHLYGWPDSASAEEIAAVKARGEHPTEYKGSVLLSAMTEPDENARVGQKSAFNCAAPDECKYMLRLDVFQVSEVPEALTNARVYVTVGMGLASSNNYRSTRPIKLDGVSSMEWLDNRSAQIKFQSSWPKLKKSNPYSEAQVPDIFVNLMCGGKRIGYNRFKYNLQTVKQLGQGQIKWYTLKPDKFDNLVPDGTIPGFLQYRLQFGEKDRLPRAPNFPATSSQEYLLRAHIFQGKQLPSADANGLSDPFLEIRMGSQKKATSTIQETLYPRWYETTEFQVRLPTNHEMRPDISVLVWDQDLFSADYLGRFIVPSKTIQPKYNPEPQWREVMVGDEEDNMKEGFILCSFQLMKYSEVSRVRDKGDYGPEAPNGIEPERFPCKFEVLVVGVRNLEPYNLLDISNPSVELDAGDKASMQRTETGSGPNASFMQMKTLQLLLPHKALFAPNVNVRIIDDRLLGEVVVGTTSIPVAPYMKWSDSSLEVEAPQIKDAGVFQGQNEEAAEQDQEEPQIQDYLPFTMEEANEMEDAEFREFVFEKKVKAKKGAGQRTMKPVESQELAMAECQEDELGQGKKKEKPRELIMTQWEVSPAGFDNQHPPPFDEYKIKRGQKKGGGLLSGMLGMSQPEKIVGTLKVKIRCYREDDNEAVKAPTVEDAHKNLMRDQRMSVRLYVIQGLNLMAQDDDGFSDPFMNVHLTNHPTVMDKARTLRKKTLQPLFYVMYEFRDCTMPGDHTLTIEVWDEDLIGDDLIGKAKIDLENRWYCKKWFGHDIEWLKRRPKELVPLWSPMSGVPQGRLELWVDTLTEQIYFPPEKMEPPKGEPWELRVVCWRVDEIMFRDKFKIDMFASGFLEYKDISNNQQTKVPREDTDTHWNIDAGDPGVFHWRWIMPLQIPCKDPRLLVQTWDVELLTPNDALAEANLALQGLFKKAAQNKLRQQLKGLSVNMTHPNYGGVQSVIKLDVDVVPGEEARQQPAIRGRDGDEFLTKDFKRPPGAFSKLIGGLSPFGSMKKYLIIACIVVSIVAVLGIIILASSGA